MRVLRLVVISFIFFFLLATGFSLMIPSHVRISKAINIKADKDSIMAPIRDVARWKEWYPGIDSARLMNITITRSETDEVEAQFTSKKMKPVTNVWKTIYYPSGDSTTLQWYMDFHLRWYPWEKFASLLLEKSYGVSMEKGLGNLKRNLGN